MKFSAPKLQKAAGLHADVAVLKTAIVLGLNPRPELMHGAAESGSLAKVQWLVMSHYGHISDKAIDCAVCSGSVEVTKYLRQVGRRHPSETSLGMTAWGVVTAGRDCLPMVQYIHDSCESDLEGWSQHVMARAAAINLKRVIEWLISAGHAPTEAVSRSAAFCNHKDLLQWLKEAHQVPLGDDLLTKVARGGSSEVFQYLLKFQQITEHVRREAVLGTDPSILHWPVATCSCTLTSELCRAAADHGNLANVMWLREKAQCAWDASEVVKLMMVRHYYQGAEEPVQMLKFAYRMGEVFNAAQLTELMNCAAIEGHLQCVQWLRQRGAEWPDRLYGVGEAGREYCWRSGPRKWAGLQGCTSPGMYD